MMFDGEDRWRRPREHQAILDWVKTRITPMDESMIRFLASGNNRALEEFSQFCHYWVGDRSSEFTAEHRRRLYRRWLASGQPCLMSVVGKTEKIIGATVVLPLSKERFHEYCLGELDALDIESYNIEHNAPKSHCYLAIDIMAFHNRNAEVLEGMPQRSLLRHIAELYNPDTMEGLTIACGTGNKGLRGRLRDLRFDQCGKEAGADAWIYRAEISNCEGAPPQTQEICRLIQTGIAAHYSHDKVR